MQSNVKALIADELYIAIVSQRDADVILFYEQGGVDIGDVDAKVHLPDVSRPLTVRRVCAAPCEDKHALARTPTLTVIVSSIALSGAPSRSGSAAEGGRAATDGRTAHDTCGRSRREDEVRWWMHGETIRTSRSDVKH